MVKKEFSQKVILVICSILLLVGLLEVGLRMGGFIILASREFVNGTSHGRRNEYRILCLGESTTYDGGIYCYPNQLEVVLNNKKKDMKFKVINNGIPGIDTGGIVEQLEDALNKYNPDIVVVMMGVNDDPANKLKEIFTDKKSRSFFKELKTYKLLKILKMNIIDKLENHRKNIYFEKGYVAEDPKTKEKILMLQEEIEKDPSNSFAVWALRKYYKRQGKIEEIEHMYKKLIDMNKINNDRIKVYVDLARFYQETRRFGEIEKMYKEAIKKTPGFIRLYCELSIYYRDHEKYSEAEKFYKRAIQIEPKNSVIYDNLGDCYAKQHRYGEAEKMYKKARDLHPKHINTSYEELGKESREIGNYEKIERTFKKILEIDSNDANAYFQLAKCYTKQNKVIEAEKMYRKYVGLLQDYYMRYAVLALFYQKQGQIKLAEKYFKKIDKIDLLRKYDPNVVYNYRKLKELVMKRGLKLVCVQYPMRSVKLLERILGSKDDIIFVDNEKIFRNAVEEASYEMYFIDNFAGDFGHCTRKGNKLLADNIADVILNILIDNPNNSIERY